MQYSLADRMEAVTAAYDTQSEFLSTVSARHGARFANGTMARANALGARAGQMIFGFAQADASDLPGLWASYLRDSWERGVLTLDLMRQWSDMHIAHAAAGAPPVLIYDYDFVMDGAALPDPCNYVLLRVRPDVDQVIHEWKRPYVIIDPRAGHGAGIGGSKKDSQVGVALSDGHPVYFVGFRQMPEKGQTLASVARAEAAFLREVKRLHPESPNPIVVGNCQGGWATAILAATHPDLTGPIVLNGAPMAYWSGTLGQDPMRYSGGLAGGVLPALMAADLGGGVFDGAYLVQNFEGLNPGRNLFRKYFDLYRDPQNRGDRFLEFEKWWGAFYCMTGEEIAWIVGNLFVGNRLTSNTAQLEVGQPIDLKAIRAPIICFASHGDNITPVGQALNWIVDTYANAQEIEVRGQKIIYLVHEQVGHLGIFVSSKIAKREHKEMASTLKTIEALPPGLYEMVIEDVAGVGTQRQFAVSFAKRKLGDVAALSGSRRDEPAFAAVARASEAGAELYATTLGPVIQAVVDERVGIAVRHMHPMRTFRRSFSSSTPGMGSVSAMAERVHSDRAAASPANPFLAAESLAGEMIETGWNIARDIREASIELAFFSLWASPFALAYGMSRSERRTQQQAEDLAALPLVKAVLDRLSEGGHAEGVLRILVLLASTRRELRQDRLARSAEVLNQRAPFSEMDGNTRERLIQEQTMIVDYRPEEALNALPQLLSTQSSRERALDLARYIVGDPSEMNEETRRMLHHIEEILHQSPAAVAE